MSNLIKYPYVRVKDKEVFVIDSDARDSKFVPIGGEATPAVKPTENITKVQEVEETPEPDMKACREEAEMILDEARRAADQLLIDAHNNVKQIHNDAYQAGKIEGYSAGEVEAKENIRILEEELRSKIEEQEEKYAILLEEIEPKYVDVLISLLQKLTGVIMEEHKGVLLYLIKSCMANLDKSKKYVIRISKEDANLIEGLKEEIKEIVGEEAAVEYWEEKSLKVNECIIETDSQIVDCGFQTQLNNLIETLKFLVS